MTKVDKVVIKETKYIAFWIVVLSIIMEAVFLILNKWNLAVLFGNLLSASLGVLNFFLMGLGVQKAVTQEEKEARQTMKLSNMLRMFLMVIVVVLGVSIKAAFDMWAVLIPLFFPRIAMLIRPIFNKRKEVNENE